MFAVLALAPAVAQAQAAFSFDLTGPFPVGDMQRQGFQGAGQVAAPADLNGDGHVDLAVVGQSHLLPTVLLGDGAGRFVPGPVPVGTTGFGHPTAVVAADLDGDGDQDVAYAESYLGATVLLNDGTGLLHLEGSFAGGKTAVSLAAADLDGDGDVDLALGYLGGMATLLNDGSGGGFVERDVALGGALPADLAAGDFDGDGDVDVAAANLAAEDDGSGDDVLVLDNDGAGVFTVAQRVDVVGLGTISVVAAQLSSDRKVDLAVASVGDSDPRSLQGGPAVTILENDGSGSFSAAGSDQFRSLISLAAADFDGNGRDDLVVVDQGATAIYAVHVRPRDSAMNDAYFNQTPLVDDLGVETATIDAGDKPDIIIASEDESLFTALNTTGPPDTSIVSGPADGATVDDPTPTFGFATDEPNTRFQCAVDNAAYSRCHNPATLDALTDGPHTLIVRAHDSDDHYDQTPATRTFTVDTPSAPSTPSTPSAPSTPSTPSTPASPSGPSTPSTPPPPSTPSTATPGPLLFPGKMQVARARIDRRSCKLDVLAWITSRASGTVDVELHAAGRREFLTAPVDPERRWVRFLHDVPRRICRLGTGIVTLSYPGDEDTREQVARVRAARRHASLDLERPTLVDGRLLAEGTVNRRATGIVRLELQWQTADDGARSYFTRARIHDDGSWRIDEQLPAEVLASIAARRGSLHSYTAFTGDFESRVRGELESFRVLGP